MGGIVSQDANKVGWHERDIAYDILLWYIDKFSTDSINKGKRMSQGIFVPIWELWGGLRQLQMAAAVCLDSRHR